ncbi:hypothetical protein [Mycolicibacterium komossense]|uniref:Uncharacterized protein n=1 Tax=Mycolicibacterium komossense TaxID=1779 RepID=A0ABT3C7A7_9MYCO|nr:hypothetical protein [Mycolicibacterium komossense]MCV7225311.1 hypothetical protein [Mycolicibacterium komossense]
MKIAVAGVGLAAALISAPHAVAEPDGVFFVSPLGGISCEIDWQRGGIPNQVYCQTASPPQTVTMDDGGVINSCMDVDHADFSSKCNRGDPGDAPTLAYGQTAGSGPFTCRSETTGVTCTIPNGRGFTISSGGIVRVG